MMLQPDQSADYLSPQLLTYIRSIVVGLIKLVLQTVILLTFWSTLFYIGFFFILRVIL